MRRLLVMAALATLPAGVVHAQGTGGAPATGSEVKMPSTAAVTAPPLPNHPPSAPAASATAKAAERPSAAKPEAAPAEPPSGTNAVVLDVNAVTSVIGMPVKSELKEDMGHLVDILVTPHGDVRAAVIDFGGVLGVGSRKVAVAWKTLRFEGDGKDSQAILALTRNQVRVAPEYKAGDPVVVLELPKNDEGKVKAEPKAPARPPAASAPDARK